MKKIKTILVVFLSIILIYSVILVFLNIQNTTIQIFLILFILLMIATSGEKDDNPLY